MLDALVYERSDADPDGTAFFGMPTGDPVLADGADSTTRATVAFARCGAASWQMESPTPGSANACN